MSFLSFILLYFIIKLFAKVQVIGVLKIIQNGESFIRKGFFKTNGENKAVSSVYNLFYFLKIFSIAFHFASSSITRFLFFLSFFVQFYFGAKIQQK
jgi:hypothetical protein